MMAKILVVDDNVDMLDTLEHLFAFYDFEVLRAENGKIGVEVAQSEQPGVIILDALMPVMNGFEACEKLKKNNRTKDIPIIFLSANYTDRDYRIKGFELGADDYILKPFNAKELVAKVNALLHRKKMIEKLRRDNLAEVQKQEATAGTESLLPRAAELKQNQIIDALTGLYNYFYFQNRFVAEYHQSKKIDSDLALLLADVDCFGRINEIYSETTGDYVLMRIANVMIRNTRSRDIVFRLGKNKFAILLPETSETGAYYEAERIRAAIQQTQFFDQDFFQFRRVSRKRSQHHPRITISNGLAARQKNLSMEDLLKNAENALTQAKFGGRNKTFRYSDIARKQKTV